MDSSTVKAMISNLFQPMIVGGKSKMIMPEEILSAILLDADSILLFKKAITHVSYSYEDNYEKLELIGDKIMNSIVANMFYEKYGQTRSHGDLSNAIAYYVSNPVAAEMMAKFKIDGYIRIDGVEIDSDIKADVFEALFMATYASANKVISGIGQQCCDSLYKKFFYTDPEIAVNEKHFQGASKTVVIEVLKKLVEYKPGDKAAQLEELPRSKEAWNRRLTVKIVSDDVLEIMNDLSPGRRAKKEFTATSNTRAEASAAIYEEILSYLNELGITKKSAAEKKMAKDLKSRPLSNYVKDVTALSEQAGFVRWEIIRMSTKKSTNVITFMLVGFDANDKGTVLKVESGDGDTLKTKVNLLEGYVKMAKAYEAPIINPH